MIAVIGAAGALALAQSTVAPLGVAEATARRLIDGAVRDNPRALRSTSPFVVAVRRAYERIPASARGTAVTAAFAWARAYVTSPAFAKTYATIRQGHKPAGATVYDQSVEEELQEKVKAERTSLEESKQGVALLPEADRPALLAAFKEAEQRLADPQLIEAWRDEIESRRNQDSTGMADAARTWNETYPEDPRVFVRQQLRQFLEATAGIDFSVPPTIVRNLDGTIVGFVAPVDKPVLPSPEAAWAWVECQLAGQDAVTAARSAAEAMLKELS